MKSRMSVVAMVVTVVVGLVIAGGEADARRQLAPDLRVAKPRQLTLCGPPSESQVCPPVVAGGTRLLRFSATIKNTGRGPLRIHATRVCPDCDSMVTVQEILRSDGTWRKVPSAAMVLFETDDDHYHWHVQGMEGYALWPLRGSAGEPTTSSKYGFCFFDGLHVRPGLDGSPPAPEYRFGDCGNPNSTELRMGLSVGWGDIYPWDFYGQFIDVTEVPDGRYLLCLTADAADAYVERNDDNNESWAEIKLRANRVRIVERGRTSCAEKLSAGA